MHKAMHDNISIVRPLDQNPLSLWKKLLNAESLKTPSNVFQMSSVDGAMIKVLA